MKMYCNFLGFLGLHQKDLMQIVATLSFNGLYISVQLQNEVKKLISRMDKNG